MNYSPFQTIQTTESRCFKLTPSMLTFLWDDCKRCFWLQAREQIYRPRTPFPSVFTRYHEILQQHFEGKCPSAVSRTLPKGRICASEAWVKSAPLHLPGLEDTCCLKGRVDHLMRFDDGSWGIIDYKTTRTREVNVAKYARQLHAYAWALEQAAQRSFHVAPLTRMGLLCLEPVDLLSFSLDKAARVELRPEWIEVKRDDAAFRRFVIEVVELLSNNDPPEPGYSCSHCEYVSRLRKHDEKVRESGWPF